MPAQVSLFKEKSFSFTLHEGLQNTNFHSEGGKIGFACFYLYERDAELPKDAVLTKNVNDARCCCFDCHCCSTCWLEGLHHEVTAEP